MEHYCVRPWVKILLFLGLFVCLPAFSAWNLPYTRPKKYDYSDFYHSTVKTDLAINPNFFKDALTKGWAYYKQTFIMQNGLVNHMRGDEGANEAVSEGQGYGMLLALLNNDQQTFNRIFEAADKHMWNDGRKSYFVWNWPSGGSGAATDADLDIGLALVFADELRKAGHWEAYNRGGVTYGSRAKDIIKSIRQNMTDQNYLLPGDNWGGSGLSNLNPSYFATAALRVFDQYQDEVDFGPVIANCYQVLKKMPNYSKGQAADWITKDGGNGSRGSKDMGPDGIRTPYRIGLDALWFDSPDAIQYCKNTKGTLTQYKSPEVNSLLAQMGYYSAGGQMENGTAYFENMAMWSCGILGSKDKEYTQSAFRGGLFLRIIGDGRNFGSLTLQDHKYYYKQSLGMLGFAVITGQFPNVLDDMRNPVVSLRLSESPAGEGSRFRAVLSGMFLDARDAAYLVSGRRVAVPTWGEGTASGRKAVRSMSVILAR